MPASTATSPNSTRRPSRRVLLTLPCGHVVDLSGHGIPPDITDPWFVMADTFLSEDAIDAEHTTLSKWIVYDGAAVAESVLFLHGGTDAEPLLEAVARFVGRPDPIGWVMDLEPMEAAS